MVDDNKISKQATSDILIFSKRFYLKYGVYPTVIYTLNKDKIKTTTLPEMENTVNNVMKNIYGINYTVRSKTRLRDVVMHRQIMFKLLYDMGYTITAISKYFTFNHATILYSKNIVEDFLKINDVKFSTIYNNIINEIKQENGDDAFIQPVNSGELIT